MDATDDPAVAFYTRYGFLRLSGRRLYRWMSDIRTERALHV